MSRQTYVMRDGNLVPKDQAAPLKSGGVHIISDHLPDLRHPITGKRMDSKSAFRAVTRAHGCVEVGNETQRDTRQINTGNIKADIARAIESLGG